MQDMQNNEVVTGAAPERSQKNNKLWLLIVSLAIIVVGGVTWAAVNFYNQNQAADVAALQDDGPTVMITDTGFNPSTIKVKAGQEVTWASESGHETLMQADAATLPGFDSGETLVSGDSYTYTFESPGTFTYFDANDPVTFKGTVIVE